jgi:hypothetical protein
MSEESYRPAAYLDTELVDGLEPDQLVAASSKPLPRMTLTPSVRALLWILRLFVLVIGALVVYTFFLSVISPEK